MAFASRLVPALWTAAVLFWASPIHAADFDPAAFEEFVAQALLELNVPGAAVVVVKDDQVIFLKGFGVHEKGKPEAVSENTVFPIASCSKAFTATLLAMLGDEGKLKWDDKVRDHLDFFRLSDELADREVTIRDLLSHRTGMPRHDLTWSGESDQSSESVIRQWGKGRSSTSFRSSWEYSNVPFITAGVIAGQKEKLDWASAVRKRLFEPLKMSASSGTWKEGVAAEDHTTPHYFAMNKSITPVKWDRLDHAGGAGAINSTATDLGNWLRFQLAGGKFNKEQLLSEKWLKETHSPQMLFKPEGSFALYFPHKVGRFHSYGLGWFVHDYRGLDCVSHGGTLTGIRAQCMLIPEKRLGVFVVCNVRPSLFPEAVAKTALDQLLGLPEVDWVKFSKNQLALFDFNIAIQLQKRKTAQKKDTKPSLPLKDYVGEYSEPAYGKAKVFLEDDQLMVKCGKYVFKLEHYHFDTFTALPVEPVDEAFTLDRSTFEVQFRLNSSGTVESMRHYEQDFAKSFK